MVSIDQITSFRISFLQKNFAVEYSKKKKIPILIIIFNIDGKYLVLPSGELHIREVGPEDGYKSYQCRTKHRLTGETRLSATKGRLVITGKFFICHLFIRFFYFIR